MELEKSVDHNRRSTDVEVSQISGRMNTLESTLQTFIASTDKQIYNLNEAVRDGDRHILDTIEQIRMQQTNNSRTNWGNLAAWASVLVVLLGLVVYAPLQELRTDLANHTQGGHPDSVLTKLNSDEAKLTERLNEKREQLIKIETRLDQLEQEQATHRSYNARIEGVEDEIRRRTEIIVQVKENEAKTNERLLSLERMVHPHVTYRSGRPEGSVPAEPAVRK